MFAVALAVALPFHTTVFDLISVSAADPVVAMYALVFAVPVLGVLVMRIGTGVGLFLLFAGFSSLLGSNAPHFSANEFVVQLAKMIASFMFLAVAIHIARFQKGILEFFLAATVGVAGAFAANSILEVFVFNSAARATFPFTNPNAYAAYLTLALAIGVRNLIAGKSVALALASSPLILGGLLATGSRGALVGVAIGIIAATLSLLLRLNVAAPRSRRPGFVVVVGVLVGVVGAGAWLVTSDNVDVAALQRVTASLEGDGRNISIRLALWELATDAFEESPIFGIGLGQFPPYADRAIGIRLVTHNTYLSFLVETGLLGFSIFLGFVLYLLRCSLICVRRDVSAVWYVIVLFAVMTQAFFTNVDNFRGMWIFAGILLVAASEARSGQRRRIDANLNQR